MKKIALILSIIFALVVACETTPKKTPPEQSVGLKLPNGVSVRETPRGSVLKLSDGNEVKFRFDRTIEIGSYDEAYNLVHQVIKDNPSIKIIVEGNSSKEGRAQYNYNLSQRRSDKSYNYLIKLGVQNSKLLYYIFNTHFKYYDKEINFAKDFSLYIVGNEYKDKIKNAKFENVYREFQTKDGRRIDILIVFDKFEIIIENKINAGEQESQLEDYYKDRYNNGKEIFLVYLTRWKYEASEYSISKETKEELKDKIYYLSHGDMAKWIENDILNKYEFLKFDKKYQSIYSALIQIRDNEKTITNLNEENNMEKEEIKKFFEREDNNYFETLLNKDETIKDSFDKLNKFYELLENAQRVIIDKKFELISGNIKYSSKVSEFIKKVQSDKGEDYMKGALLYNEEGIKGQFNGIWSRNILISIIGYLDLCITLEQNIYIVDYHLFINMRIITLQIS